MANMAQAIRMALHMAEEHLELKDVFGEDVGPPLGGAFTCTQGIKCAWNSPLDERGIIGVAIGIGLTGQRCVAEIQFADYILNAIDHLRIAGMIHWATRGMFDLPIVVRTPVGAGIHGSIYHSHSFDTIATHLPGWKVVCPSTPLDAYGLLLSAIEDPNPVLYLEPKGLLRVKGKELIPGEPADARELSRRIDKPVGADGAQWEPDWPELELYRVPIGKAKLMREGKHATILSYSRQAQMAAKAADQLAMEGYTFDVIDLRTLFPYDWDAICQSVEKTRRVLVINEDSEVTNFGEHLIRRIVDELFYVLEARPRLLAAANVPGVGLHPNLEHATVPQPADVLEAMRAIATERGLGEQAAPYVVEGGK
ncbi:MAG: transketolase C-terminal domain-containing protein [Deltaproteobacteria bacterium]|nr:transketolase C-terminal domain-containing protein [Deltaproteobacteria bacterium]